MELSDIFGTKTDVDEREYYPGAVGLNREDMRQLLVLAESKGLTTSEVLSQLIVKATEEDKHTSEYEAATKVIDGRFLPITSNRQPFERFTATYDYFGAVAEAPTEEQLNLYTKKAEEINTKSQAVNIKDGALDNLNIIKVLNTTPMGAPTIKNIVEVSLKSMVEHLRKQSPVLVNAVEAAIKDKKDS